jgi:sarcosine oxidase
MWGEFEAHTATEALVRCGCLNIAKRSVTPDLAGTYAQMSHEVLRQVGLETQALEADAVRRRFPYLDADMARLDVDAGVADLPAVTRTLTRVLAEHAVETVEGVETTAIVRDGDALRVLTDAGEFATRALVVTAGHGTNDLLARLAGCRLQVPLTRDRPSEAKYLVPPAHARERFVAGTMPVIAYLDAGIYCHPIVDGLVDAVKIGYYNPPDMPRGTTSIDSVASFVAQCMPGLADAEMRDVEDVDQCDYDLVADDDFVLGPIPGVANAFVGVGWRGTGYKFAPWVGRVLADLALAEGAPHGIDRFDPARFQKGGTGDEQAVAQDVAGAPR